MSEKYIAQSIVESTADYISYQTRKLNHNANAILVTNYNVTNCERENVRRFTKEVSLMVIYQIKFLLQNYQRIPTTSIQYFEVKNAKIDELVIITSYHGTETLSNLLAYRNHNNLFFDEKVKLKSTIL